MLQSLQNLIGSMLMTKTQHSAKDDAFIQFWQRYLNDHRRYGTRLLHFVGNCVAVGALVLGAITLNPIIPLVGLVMGYVFAWSGHLLVEHNRPSMAAHPLWSFICDVRMFRLWMAGRLGAAYSAIDDTQCD
jgi:hypothetical protein